MNLQVIDEVSQSALATEGLSESARDYLRGAKSEATRRAYHSDLLAFAGWCEPRGLRPLPADPRVLAEFIAAQAQEGPAAVTIGRRLAAISHAHRALGLEDPTRNETVRAVYQGVRRALGVEKHGKRPLLAAQVRAITEGLRRDNSLAAARDRALILLGFAAARRRSELAALTVADIEFVAEGLKLRVRRSKTDQAGEGFTVAVAAGSTPATCPAAALRGWLERAGISEGFIFREIRRGGHVQKNAPLSGKSIAEIIKRRAAEVGLVEGYAAHSLRSGFATSAAAHGASLFKIMDITGHKKVDTLRAYVREAEAFRNHAAEGLL